MKSIKYNVFTSLQGAQYIRGFNSYECIIQVFWECFIDLFIPLWGYLFWSGKFGGHRANQKNSGGKIDLMKYILFGRNILKVFCVDKIFVLCKCITLYPNRRFLMCSKILSQQMISQKHVDEDILTRRNISGGGVFSNLNFYVIR